MKTLAAWLKSMRWIVYLIVAVAAGVLLMALRQLFVIPRPEGPSRLPDVPPKLREKVEKAHEEAIKAKVEAKVEAAEDKRQVEEIMKIDDGAERRKRLAEKLRTL